MAQGVISLPGKQVCSDGVFRGSVGHFPIPLSCPPQNTISLSATPALPHNQIHHIRKLVQTSLSEKILTQSYRLRRP